MQSQLNRVPKFMSQIWPQEIPTDDKLVASIRTLNKKQRMVFDVLHHWARNYVKNVCSKKKSSN